MGGSWVECTSIVIGGGDGGGGNPSPPTTPGGSGGGGGGTPTPPTPGGGSTCNLQGGPWYGFVPPIDPCAPPLPPQVPSTRDTILNPCKQIQILQNNAGFKTMMQDLKDHANNPNDTTEHGYVYNYLPASNSVSIGAITGQPGKKYIDIDYTGTGSADGVAHNHFINSLSVFSPQDLWGLAKIFTTKNAMIDSSTFTIPLVTASGTQYIMMIENITKFRKWANKYLQLGLKFNENIYTDNYQINRTNTKEDNELHFLQFLKTSLGDCGLKLFKGNADFTQWTPLALTADNKQLVEGACAVL
ncbi:MAG: hypothetical protein WDM90_09840 [Ferruginibacter sp.]